jgi:tetratricopeptide (TPR) repeat protein
MANRIMPRQLQRDIAGLALLCVAAIAMFAVTHAMAGRERLANLRDAAAWYQAGQRHAAQGRRDDAIRALRRATVLDRDRREYATALGRALGEAGRPAEAERVLVRLRAASPDDPAINLELARLAAARAAVDAAVHYYHSALYGIWPGDDVRARNDVRAELARFLMAHGRRPAALAELVALGTTLPDTARARTEVGAMFLGAGDPARAYDEFRRALVLAPDDREALAGAGEAAFALGRYAEARRHLRRAGDLEPRLVELRDLADDILSADPLAPRIAPAERRRRLASALQRADARAGECLARLEAADPARLSMEAAAAGARAVAGGLTPGGRSTLEHIERGVDLMYRIERSADEVCPGGTRLDRALLVIGQRHADSPDE